MSDYHQKKIKEVIKELGSGSNGLTEERVQKRLKVDGPNLLQAPKKEPIIIKFLKQFKEFLIIILLVAAVLCLFVPDHMTDAFVIFGVVLLNATMGFYQEFKAEKAIFALKRLSANEATVIRDGKKKKVSAADLVRGDVVLFQPGLKIPADCRLMEVKSLEVDESILTGESNPVQKYSMDNLKNVPLAERKNMVYMGTLVTAGEGQGIIVTKGMDTEIGKITKMVMEEDESDTPLVKQLDMLGKALAVIAVIIGVVVAVLVWWKGGFGFSLKDFVDPFLMFISILVAVVPEGLPVVTALTLTIGMQTMAKKNAIVRRLSGVETLGCTTYICTDKTGTLTKNEMTVKKLYVNGRILNVLGEGYNADGSFTYKNEKIKPDDLEEMDLLLKYGMLCNDVQVIRKKNRIETGGSPTDRALFHAAQKGGYDYDKLKERFPQLAKIPFTSERKIMITFHMMPDGENVLVLVKGAPEIVIDLCRSARFDSKNQKFTEKLKQRYRKMNIMLGIKTYRNLGLAYAMVKPEDLVLPSEEDQKNISEFLRKAIKFNFVGLFALWDPPRSEVMDAIKLCKSAGIKVVMVTGDQTATALAIGEKIGIYKEGNKVLRGSDLEYMDDSEFDEIVNDVSVYTRTSPQHKMRIVQALKRKGEIVAMTGDGVNDAPALARADIGVAMGQSGSDVARDASTMILTDDNFATIVTAVEEGRKIYSNIKRFVRYQVSTNVGAILLIMFAIFLGLPIPLFPVQILWINILIDGPPAIALGMEPVTQNVMNIPPRPRKEKILQPEIVISIFTLGLVMAFGTIFLYNVGLISYGDGDAAAKARTIAFTTFVIFQLFNVLNCKSDTETIFSKNLFSNKFILFAIGACLAAQLILIYVPPAQALFYTVPLGWQDWIVVLGVSISIIGVEEIAKYFRRNPIFG